MVCGDCEKKLSRNVVADVWKDGARNINTKASTKNTLLKSNKTFAPGLKTCKICKSKLHQVSLCHVDECDAHLEHARRTRTNRHDDYY